MAGDAHGHHVREVVARADVMHVEGAATRIVVIAPSALTAVAIALERRGAQPSLSGAIPIRRPRRRSARVDGAGLQVGAALAIAVEVGADAAGLHGLDLLARWMR
jgi:hypothetical protein